MNTEYDPRRRVIWSGVLLLFVAAWKKEVQVTVYRDPAVFALLRGDAAVGEFSDVSPFCFPRSADVDAAVNAVSPKIFMWAPIAWALAGYFLTGWRWVFKTAEAGRDCLVLAAVLSVVMAVVCGGFCRNTAGERTARYARLQAMGMLRDPSFLVFILISIAAAGMMQFYFLGTAQFMQDRGIAAKNVPASMAVAQAMQAAATLVACSALFLGQPATSGHWLLGATAWLILYILYVAPSPRWLIVVAQAFHGLAYVFFIIAGQVFGSTP